MKCIKPITLSSGVVVNCGHCMNCRINYTSAWKLRLLYELSNWDKAMFLTLSYDNDHLPEDSGLHKKELVNFFKRLRAYLDYSDESRKIKYYACGEYGSKGKRPHYHAIIFGLCPYSDKDKEMIIDAWQHRCEDWQFDRNRGRKCAIQNVTPEDIEYVTGYVQKKLSGKMAYEEYGDREKPFAIMSKGLGLEFALQNANRLRTNGFTYISGHKISLPRYYRDKLEIKVDYTNIPKKTVEQYEQDLEYLTEKFEHDMALKGIDVSHKLGNLDNNSKMFERWYESHRWQLADQVFRDFQQRQNMRLGL